MTIGSIERLFRQFIAAPDLRPTLELFQQLCSLLDVSPSEDHSAVYGIFRDRLQKESSLLWKSLDKRRANTEYGGGEVCKGVKALIVGAGPCGLRLAIECAMLGVKTVVIEAREYFSRNNVLHLWPFVIQDIKMLGGKAIFPRFCTGDLDHVSIRRLQLMLLKMALLLGVEVHTPVRYEGMLQPQAGSGEGWKADLTPAHSPAARLDYDVVVGANGKTGGAAFPDFSKKVMRGRLAIAITANFVNKNKSADVRVRELGGLAFIYKQQFFKNLKVKCGMDLENFVYFKDDTHYFVMAVKKACLLEKGILKQNYPNDPAALLSPQNRDMDKLRSLVKEVAMEATENQIPNYEFALNHHGKEDVAMFDFTSMSMVDHSCYVKKRGGRTLLQCIVGDNLLEPFWPTGSGCALGFLGVLDTAWLIRRWFLRELPEAHLIADREAAFQILSQAKPNNMAKAHSKYTINPVSRYGTRILTKTFVAFDKVKHLIETDEDTGSSKPVDKPKRAEKPQKTPSKQIRDKPVEFGSTHVTSIESKSRKQESRIIDPVSEGITRKKAIRGDSLHLLSWFQTQLHHYIHLFSIDDLHESWRDGLAFCALIELFRPHALQLVAINHMDRQSRVQIGLMLMEQEFDVEPMLSADAVCGDGPVDKLTMLAYLVQVHETLQKQTPRKDGALDTRVLLSWFQTQLQNYSDVFTIKDLCESWSDGLGFCALIEICRPHMCQLDAFRDVDAQTRVEIGLTLIEQEFGVKPNLSADDIFRDGTVDKLAMLSYLMQVKKKLENEPFMKKLEEQPDTRAPAEDSSAISQQPPRLDPTPPRPDSGKLSAKALLKTLNSSFNPEDGRFLLTLYGGAATDDTKTSEKGATMNAQANEPTDDDMIFCENNEPTPKEKMEDKPYQSPNDNASRPGGKVPDWMLQSTTRAECYGLVHQALRGIGNPQQGSSDTTQRQVPDVPRGRVKGMVRQHGERSSSPAGDLCCVCRNPLLLVQRYKAHGVIFHKACFRCATCDTALHMRNSDMKNKHGQVQFYCETHAGTAREVDVVSMNTNVSKMAVSKEASPGQDKQGTRRPVMLGQADSASNIAASESSEEEEDDDDDGDDVTMYLGEEADVLSLLTTMPKKPTRASIKKALRSERSQRMLIADDIQMALQEVRSEEEALNEKGRLLETRLRTKIETSTEDEEFVGWLDVFQKKKELEEREAKLELKTKLLEELQERQSCLQQALKVFDRNDEAQGSRVDQLNQDTQTIFSWFMTRRGASHV